VPKERNGPLVQGACSRQVSEIVNDARQGRERFGRLSEFGGWLVLEQGQRSFLKGQRRLIVSEIGQEDREVRKGDGGLAFIGTEQSILELDGALVITTGGDRVPQRSLHRSQR